jgi:hypothetical protein
MARAKLRKLTQDGSVKAYNDAFAKLIVDLPFRHERDNVDDYITGLSVKLREPVSLQFPTRVDWAMQLALQLEETQRNSKWGKGASGEGSSGTQEASTASASKGKSAGKSKGASGGKVSFSSGGSVSDKGCFKCGSPDHWKRECPNKKKPFAKGKPAQ